MIRIQYKDFSAGTHDVTWQHGRAERCARGVTVFLVPGLTTRQRRVVLRRLQQEASRGFGPPLPRPQLSVALGLDRVRTATRIGAAIVRLHPAVTLLPGVLAASLMALFVLTSAGRDALGPGGETLEQSAAVAVALPAPAGLPAPSPAPGVAQVTRVTRATGSGAVAAVPALGFFSTWYTCQRATLSPLPGQRPPACGRWQSRAVPETAHRPVPSDLAR
jgi:hypothetical protein